MHGRNLLLMFNGKVGAVNNEPPQDYDLTAALAQIERLKGARDCIYGAGALALQRVALAEQEAQSA